MSCLPCFQKKPEEEDNNLNKEQIDQLPVAQPVNVPEPSTPPPAAAAAGMFIIYTDIFQIDYYFGC